MKVSCQYCGNKFIKNSGKHRYCSDNCKLRSWRKNNNERHLANMRKYEHSEKRKKYKKRWLENNRDKSRSYSKKFYHSEAGKKYAKEWQMKNKEKINDASNRWRRRHPEKDKLRQRKYYNTFKGKANDFKKHSNRRSYNHFIKFRWQEAKRIIARDIVCVYCGEEGTTFDHIVPVSKGGTTEYNNLVLSCKPCNCSKHNKDVHSWCKERHMEVPEIIVELLELQKEQTTI